MTKIRISSLLALPLLMAAGLPVMAPVMADEGAPAAKMAAPAATPAPVTKGDHPCRKLRKSAIEACSAAGYVKGGHKNKKGLFDDCVRPILEGKGAPGGVTIDSSLVEACQARRAKHDKK
jgi:hypothetical protein